MTVRSCSCFKNAGWSWALASVVALATPSTHAQELPATWDDARVVDRARHHAPGVRSAEAALRVAEAARVFGEVPPIGNPTVGVMALPGYPDFGAYTVSASVGIPLDVSGRRGRYREESAHAVRAADAQLTAAVATALYDARLALVDLVTVRAERVIQQARLDAARLTESRVSTRVTAGAATAVERALVERERTEAAADLAEVRQRAVAAEGALRRALDLAPTDPVDTSELTRPGRVAVDERATAGDRAQRQRQDARAIEETAARLDASESRLRAGAIAPLVVGFEAQQVAVGTGELGASIGGSVRWELPVIQRAQGDRAVARAEAGRERVQAALLRRQIARDVATTVAALDAALDELDGLEREGRPAAERLVAATEASWAAGALDIFRVLTARRDALAMQARTLDATRRAWRARLDYERAMGAVR